MIVRKTYMKQRKHGMTLLEAAVAQQAARYKTRHAPYLQRLTPTAPMPARKKNEEKKRAEESDDRADKTPNSRSLQPKDAHSPQKPETKRLMRELR
jgi:hypothetical protein